MLKFLLNWLRMLHHPFNGHRHSLLAEVSHFCCTVARNFDSLVANATRNYGLATIFLELVTSGQLTFNFFPPTF